VSPVKYELGFYTPEDDILHSHRRENLKYYEEACRANMNVGADRRRDLTLLSRITSDLLFASIIQTSEG
jgi:hypothetical protein